jgi:hypothetical protein
MVTPSSSVWSRIWPCAEVARGNHLRLGKTPFAIQPAGACRGQAMGPGRVQELLAGLPNNYNPPHLTSRDFSMFFAWRGRRRCQVQHCWAGDSSGRRRARPLGRGNSLSLAAPALMSSPRGPNAHGAQSYFFARTKSSDFAFAGTSGLVHSTRTSQPPFVL